MDNYVYFGKRSHFSCLANGSVQVSDALTAANFGIVPADFTAATATEFAQGYEIFIQTKEANASTRGTALTALGDALTGVVKAGDAAAKATTIIDDVTRLKFDTVGMSSGVLTVANFGADGTDGYLVDATDRWIIREKIGSTNDALSDVPAINQALCVNMANFISADPVDTATAATVGIGIIGGDANGLGGTIADIDQTVLSFKSVKGDATNDTVLLTHTSGAYKEVCQAMEEMANGMYHRKGKGYYTFTDLMSGNKTIWEDRLGIIGCSMIVQAV
tara:strand:+ start:617 stop:1444 length:828 start_codon:yes stop_codon:yes gene_type:complete